MDDETEDGVTDRDTSRFDQGAAFIGDHLPILWRRMYLRSIEVGFDRDQALVLLRTYVFGAAGGRMEK